MVEASRPRFAEPLLTVWITMRILAITIVGETIILATFLGYITIPIVLLSVFLLLYGGIEQIRLRVPLFQR